jgi:hypothetical protein
MTNEEAATVQVGDTVRVGELTATVEEVVHQFDDVSFATEYGNFNASVCSREEQVEHE